MSKPPLVRPLALLALALAGASAACNDPYALPPATLPPSEFTVTLYALTGTSISLPSAFDLLQQIVVRTDRTSVFDFAFDMPVDSANDTTAVFLPRGALGLSVAGGLQLTTQPYDSIKSAPNRGYVLSDPVPIQVGSVVLASSRSITCNFGYIRPLYAKMEITAIDKVARSVTFQMLVDPNCGYSSLEASTTPPSH
jgi:hypothetical protein